MKKGRLQNRRPKPETVFLCKHIFGGGLCSHRKMILAREPLNSPFMVWVLRTMNETVDQTLYSLVHGLDGLRK